MGVPRAVLIFLGRSVRRLAITLAGLALLLAGAVMLVTPGPGLLAIVAGLAVLATEYAWARRALERTRARSRQAARRVRDARRAFRENRDPPGQTQAGTAPGPPLQDQPAPDP